jgi:hypothetical protein
MIPTVRSKNDPTRTLTGNRRTQVARIVEPLQRSRATDRGKLAK